MFFILNCIDISEEIIGRYNGIEHTSLDSPVTHTTEWRSSGMWIQSHLTALTLCLARSATPPSTPQGWLSVSHECTPALKCLYSSVFRPQFSCYVVYFGIKLFAKELSKGIYAYKVKRPGVPLASNPKIGRAVLESQHPSAHPQRPHSNIYTVRFFIFSHKFLLRRSFWYQFVAIESSKGIYAYKWENITNTIRIKYIVMWKKRLFHQYLYSLLVPPDYLLHYFIHLFCFLHLSVCTTISFLKFLNPCFIDGVDSV